MHYGISFWLTIDGVIPLTAFLLLQIERVFIKVCTSRPVLLFPIDSFKTSIDFFFFFFLHPHTYNSVMTSRSAYISSSNQVCLRLFTCHNHFWTGSHVLSDVHLLQRVMQQRMVELGFTFQRSSHCHIHVPIWITAFRTKGQRRL